MNNFRDLSAGNQCNGDNFVFIRFERIHQKLCLDVECSCRFRGEWATVKRIHMYLFKFLVL